MLESDFKKKQVLKFLQSFPDIWVDCVELAYGNNGFPDVIGCLNGKMFAIEAKRKQSEANPENKSAIRIRLQQWTLDKIKKAGGLIYKVYPENFEEFKKQFTEDTK
jgi:hypothetical protein